MEVFENVSKYFENVKKKISKHLEILENVLKYLETLGNTLEIFGTLFLQVTKIYKVGRYYKYYFHFIK